MNELGKEEDFPFYCTYIFPLSSSKRKGEAVRMKGDLSPLLEQCSLTFLSGKKIYGVGECKLWRGQDISINKQIAIDMIINHKVFTLRQTP